MFEQTRWQLATIKGQSVRVKDARQKDPNHRMEFTFEIPLDADLAAEILPAMQADLYNEAGDPKPNMASVDYVIPGLSLQHLMVKDHPDLPELVAEFGAVEIRSVQAKKADDGKAWVLSFTAGWTLGADDKEMSLIRRIKKGSIYLGLQPEQASLLPKPDATDTVVETAAEPPKPKRTRKARKNAPEAEAAQQQVAGAAAAANDAAEQPADELRPGVTEEFGTDTGGAPIH